MLLMSRSRDTYHHGDLATALESAAMQLLTVQPAGDISLREVARVANVSHNAPYHHFSDRRGLLKVLAERSMAELVSAVDEAVAPTTSVADALAAGGEAYIRFAAERPNAFDVIYDPTVCVPGSPTETMAPLIRSLEEVLERIADELDWTGGDAALWALMHGTATLVAAGHLPLDPALESYRSAVTRLAR